MKRLAWSREMLKRRVKTSKHLSIIFNPVLNFYRYFYVCARWFKSREGEGSDQFYHL